MNHARETLPMPSSVGRLRRRCIVAAVALAAAGSAIISTTYSSLSGTFDETVHVTAGLELLQDGTYSFEFVHTPLARVAAAIGPYAAGARYSPDADYVERTNAVMSSGAGYKENLALARLGVLPFYLVTCLLLYLWTKRVAGDPAAVASVGLLSATPLVLAHAGLATTDAAAMASFTAVMLVFPWWLEQAGSPYRSTWLGIVIGLALACKLSALPFAGATALGLLAVFRFDARRGGRTSGTGPSTGAVLRNLCLAALIALMVVFASYGFLVSRKLGVRAPLSEFVFALMMLLRQNLDGLPSYLLGDSYVGGRWTFFPVAILVKTPIPLLLLALGGVSVAVREWWQRVDSHWLSAPVAFVVPLGIACTSNINIGLRHLLPAIPALSMLGAFGLMALWRRSPTTRGIGLVLGGWMLFGTYRIHPDQLAYFNEFADKDPGGVLVDSDLDWGQDLERLADTVTARGITHFSFAYFGFGDRAEQLFPEMVRLRPRDPHPTGWFAVSETLYRRGWTLTDTGKYRVEPRAFSWLDSFEPVARVGHSIRLYFIPAAPLPSSVR